MIEYEEETEKEVRDAAGPELIGMLTVESTVPGGPAEGSLEAGDVLVALNGRACVDFVSLEEALDGAVGGEVRLLAQRKGVDVPLTLPVGDLHAATPARLLEVWGGVVHGLSYQQARNFRAACGLVYVAEPGYVLGTANVPKFAIVTSLAKVPTPTLEAFAAALATLREGQRVPLEYYVFHGAPRRGSPRRGAAGVTGGRR